MNAGLIEATVQCPYCWEQIDVMIDDCGEDQQYIEDCQVCCRPINFSIEIDDNQQRHVYVSSDDGTD